MCDTSPSCTDENVIRQRRGAKRVFKGAIIRLETVPEDGAPYPTDESLQPLEERPSTGNRFIDNALQYLQPSELKGPTLWKGAVIECYGSAVLTFINSCSVTTSVQSTLNFPPVAIAIFNGLLLTLIIYACAAPSGGHVNPLITISTVLVKLTSPMHALLYVPAQMLGSAFVSLLFRSGMGLWDEQVTALQLAGCVISPEMKTSQAFCIEVACSFFIFLVGFGCALDPTASKAYGPIYAPLLIGVAVGLVVFGTSALVPGYTGAGVNPARCFGPTLVANEGWSDYWLVFFLGPLTAAVAHAPIYLGMPPDHAIRHDQKKQRQKEVKEDSILPEANY